MGDKEDKKNCLVSLDKLQNWWQCWLQGLRDEPRGQQQGAHCIRKKGTTGGRADSQTTCSGILGERGSAVK